MKYSNEIIIDLPREKVIALFDDPNNLAKWQEGFQELTNLSGEPGEVGSKSKLRYKMGKRTVEMIETITVKDLPNEFSGTYEAKNVWNEVRNYFEEVGNSKTKWRSDCEFKFKGFMKIMGLLMPGAFKKQSMKYLVAFKTFAESEK